MTNVADTAKDAPSDVLTESTRRYYLDVMGIQCWQLRDTVTPDVVEANIVVSDSQFENSKDAVDTDISWSQLESNIQQCKDCTLHEYRKQAILGRGNQTTDLMVVLLAPDSKDDEANLICSGEENILLSKMLSAINISIDDVYITSLLKCCVQQAHTISPKEIQSCNNHLRQQVRLIKPKFIIVLGETTIRCLLQKNLLLDDYRAMNDQPQYRIENVPIFVSYSPVELVQQAENKRKAWSDLQQLQKMIGM